MRALDDDPDHFITTIMVMRAFARAKTTYEHAKTSKDLSQISQNDSMIRLVQEIEFDWVSGKLNGEED